MQRRSNNAWRIRRLGQIRREMTLHKVEHTLGRCHLRASAIEPCLTLYLFLQCHDRQRALHHIALYYIIIMRFQLARLKCKLTRSDIFRTYLDYHSRISPSRTSRRSRHSIYHYLLRTCRRWHYNATRTHTEAIYSSPICLSDKAVFGCRQILASTLSVMILNLVDELLWMLKSRTNSYTFCFNLDIFSKKHTIDIAC